MSFWVNYTIKKPANKKRHPAAGVALKEASTAVTALELP
jgi:hypothetical protein